MSSPYMQPAPLRPGEGRAAAAAGGDEAKGPLWRWLSSRLSRPPAFSKCLRRARSSSRQRSFALLLIPAPLFSSPCKFPDKFARKLPIPSRDSARKCKNSKERHREADKLRKEPSPRKQKRHKKFNNVVKNIGPMESKMSGSLGDHAVHRHQLSEVFTSFD